MPTAHRIGNHTEVVETDNGDTVVRNTRDGLEVRISGDSIQMGAITADSVDTGPISATDVDADSVSSDSVTTGSVTSSSVDSDTVSADESRQSWANTTGRTLPSNETLTIRDGESMVVSEYYDVSSGSALEVEGDGALTIV